ncbi:hypothetical protein [Bacteroides reticulotermitis]|uniref:hypothetical protein n=1 Tax=Bacteroides reticulotermitis TaxID=1133319 RepID=UPI003A842D90
MEECIIGSGPSNTLLGKYTFVSCWTKDSKESIALWKLYTDMIGVRIALDSDMFVTYDVKTINRSFFNQREKYFDDYKISAYTNNVNPIDIQYTDDIKGKVEKLIQRVGNPGTLIQKDKIGVFKNNQWEFQRESRFIITVDPIDKNAKDQSTTTAMLSNREISDKHLYIDLKEGVFDRMEIMAGPKTDECDHIIIKSLLKTYCKDADISMRNSEIKIR